LIIWHPSRYPTGRRRAPLLRPASTVEFEVKAGNIMLSAIFYAIEAFDNLLWDFAETIVTGSDEAAGS
jgi:hypothetical protein